MRVKIGCKDQGGQEARQEGNEGRRWAKRGERK